VTEESDDDKEEFRVWAVGGAVMEIDDDEEEEGRKESGSEDFR